MNCTQARMLLAIYRELEDDDSEKIELETHLNSCAACREILAASHAIHRQVRSLAPFELDPGLHIRLMKALAAEHSQFLQKSPETTPPVPEFLKSYMPDIPAIAAMPEQTSHKTSPLVAFSSADTGPLPVIPRSRTKRRSPYMGQFAVLGLAAAILMVLMMGGITALLLIAQNSDISRGSTSVIQPSSVVKLSYTTSTPYSHVMSAVGDSTSIYYTAYGDGIHSGWMLEQLDRASKISTPLLNTESASQLIVLGSANGWLVWLEYANSRANIAHTDPSLPVHQWSIHYLALSSAASAFGGPNATGTVNTSADTILQTGTFDQATAPSWVHAPIQGIWFVQNTLLIAFVDDNGTSHLMQYQLNGPKNISPVELASATSEHILTSPTANTDGTQIYWGEEWRTSDLTFHSNIWEQHMIEIPVRSHGKLQATTKISKELALSNGMSFHPDVVNETLFFVSTATPTNTFSGTPSPATITTPTPAATATPLTPWATTNAYMASPDASIQGSLMKLILNDAGNEIPSQITPEPVSSLQAGTRFLLWQDAQGYGMYDAVTDKTVTVGEAFADAQFLAVNDSTVVWTINTPGNTPPDTTTGPTATLLTYDWVRR